MYPIKSWAFQKSPKRIDLSIWAESDLKTVQRVKRIILPASCFPPLCSEVFRPGKIKSNRIELGQA